MSLAHSVAAVTGAASGIGRALCAALGRQRTRLILVDRDAAGLCRLVAELAAADVSCAAAEVDVRDRAALRQAIRAAADRCGPVDLLVACAGITGVTLVDDLAVEQLEAIVRVNFLGMAYAIDAVLPEMLARGRGHIVGISSLAGCRGMPFAGAYSASKVAVARYLESLRPALAKRGIAVTTVYPGFVRTPLMENAPLKPPLRMLEPEAAARYVLRAIARRRRYCCFPWGLSLGVRLLSWLPPWAYDWSMSRAAAKIPDLTY